MTEKNWFKPGDKVRVVDNNNLRYNKGQILTVIVQDRGDNVRVLADDETDQGQGGYYPWRFQLVDSLASKIASVKAGDRVTVRTTYATYAEFEVGSALAHSLVSVGAEVVVDKSEIVELTITKPALPAEPGVGAIVKFLDTIRLSEQFQVRQEKGWTPIFMSGNFSHLILPWNKTIVMYGPKFEVIREGKK